MRVSPTPEPFSLTPSSSHLLCQRDADELKKCLNELKKAVGDPKVPHTLDRTNIVSNIRAIVETILKHLVRRMCNNPTFDPTTWHKEDWPNMVLEELRPPERPVRRSVRPSATQDREDRDVTIQDPKRCGPAWHGARWTSPASLIVRKERHNRLDAGFYKSPVDARNWHLKGKDNLERLRSNCHYLRKNTNPVCQPPSPLV